MNEIVKSSAAKAVHQNLFQALAAAQSEMGPALKDSTNPAFKSRYADLASVMSACVPALSKHGIAVMQPPCEVDGQRYVKTILAHESGETVECLVPLIVQKNDMQGYGSAVTYARRYGLMAMAGIAPDDDDGNAAVMSAPKQEARSEQPRRDGPSDAEIAKAKADLDAAVSMAALQAEWMKLGDALKRHPSVEAAKEARKHALSQPEDAIPY